MLRIQSVFVLLVICSTAGAQNPRAAFSAFLEVTGGEPNLINDSRPGLGFLQERPLQPGDTFQFSEKVRVAPDAGGVFELTDLVMRGSRLQPFSHEFGCTIKPEEQWLPCFINNAELLTRDPTFRNVLLPISIIYDPIEEVVTGSFTMTAGGTFWAFQLQGRANGEFVTTDPYYVFPATLNIPEPSGLTIAMLGLVAFTYRRGLGRESLRHCCPL